MKVSRWTLDKPQNFDKPKGFLVHLSFRVNFLGGKRFKLVKLVKMTSSKLFAAALQ